MPGVHAGYTFGDDEEHRHDRTSGRQYPSMWRAAPDPDSFASNAKGSSAAARSATTGSSVPSWVFGVEADISYVDNRRTTNVVTASLPTAVPPNVPLTNTFRTGMEYFGTVRGRLGYVVDRTLIYATGGLAYAEVENSAVFLGPVNQIQFTGGGRQTRTG